VEFKLKGGGRNFMAFILEKGGHGIWWERFGGHNKKIDNKQTEKKKTRRVE